MEPVLTTILDQDEPLAGVKYLQRFGVTTLELSLFAMRALRRSATPPWDWVAIQLQLFEVGWRSSILVLIVGVAVGLTTAQFLAASLANIGSIDSVIPAQLSKMMFRQLGPLMAGLLISGRVGAAMAAELAALRMSGQVEGLEVGIDQDLVVTRIVACGVAMPILSNLMSFSEILGGYGWEMMSTGTSSALYIGRVFADVTWSDYMLPTLATGTAGVVIAIISCYFGYTANASPAGVRRAATQSVVVCCLFVVALNLGLSQVLFVWIPGNAR